MPRVCTLAAALLLGLVLLPLRAALADGEAGAPPPPPPPGDQPQPDDPAVLERKKRLELDERREKLPESARKAMAILDDFRDREFRVWSSQRRDVVACGPDAVPALLIALEELDWETRAFAASCLALLGDRSAAANLADAYHAETRFDEARRQCILAIAALKAPTSRTVLTEAAGDAHPGIRLAAVRGLGALRDPETAPTLRANATSDDLDVRYEALGALAALGDEAATAQLVDEAKALVATRELERVDSTVEEDNGDRYSHYLLGLALARSDAKEAVKIVETALYADRPYDHKAFLRMGVAEGLGRRVADGEEPNAKLLSGITHKLDDVRVACSYGAGWANSAALVPKLEKALGDSQLDVRHNAVMALGRIANDEAADALVKALRDKAGEVRIGAIRALGGIRNAKTTKALVDAMRDEKYMIRVMATRALRYRTAEPEVLSALLKQARDSDYGVREQALAALAHHPDGAAVIDALASALGDSDYGVQTNACLAIARVAPADPSIVTDAVAKSVVSLYLGASEGKLEKAGLECLDAARAPGCVLPLIAGLESDSSETRTRANRALVTVAETSRNFQPEANANDRAKAVQAWREWWATRDGKLPARGARARAAITGKLQETARDLKWKGLDVALLFDSTGSMAGLIRAAKERTDEIIHELNSLMPSLRVSVFTYRDYGDSYVWYGSPLTFDTWKLSGFLQNATHGQGGDIPEAVFETTRNAMQKLLWRPEAHKVVVYAGDAPHHRESTGTFLEVIKEFCTPQNNGVLHAIYTDTNRRSLDIKTRKKRSDFSTVTSPTFEAYKLTAQAGRGKAVLLDDESALIKELLVLTFGEDYRVDIENLLDFEY